MRTIHRHLRYGGKLIGICGGFQMLGRWVHDPAGLEGEPGSSPGLGLLDFTTTLEPEKQLHRVEGRLGLEDAFVTGYEIHAGVSTGPALAQPAIRLNDGRPDGALSGDGQTARQLPAWTLRRCFRPRCVVALGGAGGAGNAGLPAIARRGY